MTADGADHPFCQFLINRIGIKTAAMAANIGTVIGNIKKSFSFHPGCKWMMLYTGPGPSAGYGKLNPFLSVQDHLKQFRIDIGRSVLYQCSIYIGYYKFNHPVFLHFLSKVCSSHGPDALKAVLPHWYNLPVSPLYRPQNCPVSHMRLPYQAAPRSVHM